MANIWFNSDIWFDLEQVAEVVDLPNEGAEVHLDVGDVITITFNDEFGNATVRRERMDNVVVYTLGGLASRYNIAQIKTYAKRHGLMQNAVMSPITIVDDTLIEIAEPPMILTFVIPGVRENDENIVPKTVDVELRLDNIVKGQKFDKKYRIDFKNGGFLMFDKKSISYVNNWETTAGTWKDPEDYRDTAVWLWDRSEFERPEECY